MWKRLFLPIFLWNGCEICQIGKFGAKKRSLLVCRERACPFRTVFGKPNDQRVLQLRKSPLLEERVAALAGCRRLSKKPLKNSVIPNQSA